MKKNNFYVISLLVLLGSTSVVAQTSKKVHLALTVNPNATWIVPSNEGYQSEGAKIGVTYGLLTDFRLFGDDNYSFSSGFTFSHLGGKLSAPDVAVSNGSNVPARRFSDYSLTNMDIPLLVRLKTNEIGYNVFYGVFGTELGFNVNAKEKYTQTYDGFTSSEKENDFSESVNLFRTSLVFGLGLERVITGETSYRIGLTYHNGLTNILSGSAFDVDANGNTLLNSNGTPSMSRDLSTKLKFLELTFSVVF